MWAYIRILRISRTEHVNNEEVLRRMGMEREVGITIVNIDYSNLLLNEKLIVTRDQEGEDTHGTITCINGSDYHLLNYSDLSQTRLG